MSAGISGTVQRASVSLVMLGDMLIVVDDEHHKTI